MKSKGGLRIVSSLEISKKKIVGREEINSGNSYSTLEGEKMQKAKLIRR